MMQNEMGKPLDYEQMYKQLLGKCAAQETLIAKLQGEKHAKTPLCNHAYDYLTNLQYKAKNLATQLEAFKSSEKYINMAEGNKARLAEKDREIKKLKQELADVHSQVIGVRKIWEQVFDDIEKVHSEELLKKDRKIKALEEKLLKAQMALDAEKDKFRDKLRELYEIRTELEDEKGKCQQLKAQIGRDYENSSQPSSSGPKRKKITNNREKTGKRPGGQPGHKGHSRKRHVPTNLISIPAPEKYADSQDYRLTGKTITKQLVDIRAELVVSEYSTPEFRNMHTGQRVHALFPEGMTNDVNYGGSIKAFAFLLNNRCNVSVEKVSDFLFELTGGELKISTGMINGLSREFSQKTEPEQKKAFADLLLSPVINVDFTSARVNGSNMNVAVCTTPSTTMYFAREHKGHEGVRGTPIEDCRNILVHDHDRTFYNYGDGHQECLEHPLRYLKASMENEPNLKWNRQMRGLIQEMIHFRNGLDPEDGRNPDKIDSGRVRALEAKYDEILNLAKTEYEYEPPGKYNKDGFNLYLKLFDYRDNHMLFLHDRRVPPTNNLAEQRLRLYKRKQSQVMAFRSFNGLDYLCRSLGTVASLCAKGENLYESVASIFDMPRESSIDTT